MPSSSSPRLGAMISLAASDLVMPGFFLPMFTQSNPQVAGSAHPVYEWQVVNIATGSLSLTVLLGVLAALPLVSMLVVFGTSIAAMYRIYAPEQFSQKRGVAGWGFAIQLLFDVFVFQLSLIGYSRTDIAWGFVVVLIGFVIMVIGAFVVKSYQNQG